MAIVLGGNPVKRSKWGSIGAGLGMGFGEGMEEAEKSKKQTKILQQENKAAEQLGMDISGITDPKTRQEIFKQLAKTQSQIGLLQSLGLKRGLGNQPTKGLGTEPSIEKPGKEFGQEGEINVGLETLVPEEDIFAASLVNPSLGNILQRQNEAKSGEAKHQQKMIQQQQLHQEKQETQRKQFFHNETQKFDDSLEEQSTAAEKKNRALDRQMANVDKLGWWDRTVSAIFGNTKFGDLLRSKTAQEFDANTLPQLEGQRQILGGVLSDSDIRLLLQKIVTASKDPQANKKIAKMFKFENELMIAKKRIGDEIKSRNDGYRPANYKSELDKIYNERYGQYIQDMQNEIMALPDDKKKLSSIARRKVGPGTVLTPEIADMYLDLTDGDLDKASQMMVEDGYDE